MTKNVLPLDDATYTIFTDTSIDIRIAANGQMAIVCRQITLWHRTKSGGTA
jgi:hypothetical protein